jgi:hypothetical protein
VAGQLSDPKSVGSDQIEMQESQQDKNKKIHVFKSWVFGVLSGKMGKLFLEHWSLSFFPVLRIQIRCLSDPWFWDGKKSGSGSGMNNPDLFPRA